jgi:plastocyanin
MVKISRGGTAMKQLGYLSIVFLLLGFLPAVLPEVSAPVGVADAQPAHMLPRTVTVQTGAGQDTVDLLTFLPEKVRIRVGDTVNWKFEGDLHTVTFATGTKPEGLVIPSSQAPPGEVIPRVFLPLPNGPQGVNMMNPALVFPTRKADQPVEKYSGTGFVNSGMMSNASLFPGTPPIQTFSVTFDTPGTFQYVCLLHQEFGMRGTVEVAPAAATDVPSQAEIDVRAQQELAAVKALLEQAKGQGRQGRSEPGPHDTKLWRILAGNSLVDINDGRVQLLEFVPKDVTIQAGDTIIWESRFFHSVTFVPTPPPPDRFLPERQPDGVVQLVRNPVIFNIARPAGVFDPAQVFNSGTIGTFPGSGITYALTFETPGVFKYFCGIHRDQGMEGTIIVQQREARSP